MSFADTSCLAHVALSLSENSEAPRFRSAPSRSRQSSRKHKKITPLECKHSRAYSLCFCASLFREDYLFENFFTALSALFGAFVRRVAVYLLRTVESSGLLYAADGNFYYLQSKNQSLILFLPYLLYNLEYLIKWSSFHHRVGYVCLHTIFLYQTFYNIYKPL